MTTLYNKTALKKIKKNDLVLMFLDLQASDYNARMDDRKLKNITPFLEEEIKELKEQIERERGFALQAIITRGKDFQPEIDELKEEIEDLKEENETLKENYEQIDNSSFLKIKELNEKIEGLREKLDIGTEQHFADCAKLNKFHRKIRDEYDRLKEDITIHPDYQRLVELD